MYTCLVTPLTPASTSNRLPSGGNLGFGLSGQNPSCLGTLLGPAAHPSLGALRVHQLGLRPNKIVEEGGVSAMVTASHSLYSCLQANFHPLTPTL